MVVLNPQFLSQDRIKNDLNRKVDEESIESPRTGVGNDGEPTYEPNLGPLHKR